MTADLGISIIMTNDMQVVAYADDLVVPTRWKSSGKTVKNLVIEAKNRGLMINRDGPTRGCKGCTASGRQVPGSSEALRVTDITNVKNFSLSNGKSERYFSTLKLLETIPDRHCRSLH